MKVGTRDHPWAHDPIKALPSAVQQACFYLVVFTPDPIRCEYNTKWILTRCSPRFTTTSVLTDHYQIHTLNLLRKKI